MTRGSLIVGLLAILLLQPVTAEETETTCRERVLREISQQSAYLSLSAGLEQVDAEIGALEQVKSDLSDLGMIVACASAKRLSNEPCVLPSEARRKRVDELRAQRLQLTQQLTEWQMTARVEVDRVCARGKPDYGGAPPLPSSPGAIQDSAVLLIYQEVMWGRLMRELIRDGEFEAAKGIVLFGDQSYTSIETAARTVLDMAGVPIKDWQKHHALTERLHGFLKENCKGFPACKDTRFK